MDVYEFNDYRVIIPIEDLLKKVNDLPNRFINILKNIKFYNEEDFFKMVDKLYIDYTSNYLFPNRLISFYPQMLERCAKDKITCHISGAVIKKGSLYYTYHPFIEDIKSGRVYTIQNKIKISIGYEDLLPKTLFEYEEWYYRLKNAYYQNNDSKIDFYNLSSLCGDNCLEPYLLGISKKKLKSIERK